MNAKWCVGTLVIILALLGLSPQQKKASNQQISLEFTEVELASESSHEEVLSTITKKLLFLGVDDIEIIENDDNHIEIRYYSDVDSKEVKEFLSNNTVLSLDGENEFPSDFPNERLPDNYDLVVSDLHQKNHKGLNLKGNLVPIQKEVYDGITHQVFPGFNESLAFTPLFIGKVALKNHSVIAIAIDNTSDNIQEVRAGPYV